MEAYRQNKQNNTFVFKGLFLLRGAPTTDREIASRQYLESRVSNIPTTSLTGAGSRIPTLRMPYTFSGGSFITTQAAPTVLILNVASPPGTYPVVTTTTSGRVTAGAILSRTNLTGILSFNKITNKPTTVAGYGINDLVSRTSNSLTGSLTLAYTVTLADHMANKTYVDSAVTPGAIPVPVGDVVVKYKSGTYTGLIRADGAEVSRTTYAALYAVIGNTYSVKTTIGNGQPWILQHDIAMSTATDITGWATTTAFPLSIYDSVCFATKNRVYTVGGVVNNANSSAVYTAVINSDGTLGAWSLGTPFPVTLARSQVVMTKNRIYVLGGWMGGATSSAVYYAAINTDGTIGTWTLGSPLPVNNTYHMAVVIQQRVYTISGYVNGSTSFNVYHAPIDDNGVIGAWALNDHTPNIRCCRSALAVVGDRIYVFGGRGFSVSAVVTTGRIGADGAMQAWDDIVAPSMPAIREFHCAYVSRNRVYVLGGTTGSVQANTVYSAPINTDGTLGAWVTGTALPATISRTNILTTKSRIYLIGGFIAGASSSAVYTAPLTGLTNDYSPYYDGTYAATPSTAFKLPNLKKAERSNLYYYLKT